MDWGQAKNILLVAFLVLNIFLGYKWLAEDDSIFISAQVTEQEKEEVRQTMRKRNIVFQGQIPEEIFDAQYLDVSNYDLDAIALAEKLYDQGISIRSSGEEELERIVEIQETGTTIAEYASGKLALDFAEGFHLDQGQYSLSEDTIEEESELLLEKFNLPDNLSLHRVYSEPAKIFGRQESVASPFSSINIDNYKGLLYYQEIEEGQLLFGGYTYIEIIGGAITGAEIYLLEQEGFHEESIEVIPATMALLRLGEYLPEEEGMREITDIAFGYYTEEYVADTWEAVPVWRIEMDTPNSYCINAFTGELEQGGSVDHSSE